MSYLDDMATEQVKQPIWVVMAEQALSVGCPGEARGLFELMIDNCRPCRLDERGRDRAVDDLRCEYRERLDALLAHWECPANAAANKAGLVQLKIIATNRPTGSAAALAGDGYSQ
jgi:hypothetical protein